MGHDVFISYSHRDKQVADAACARLEQAGRRCWIAPRDIHGGEWGKSIIEGISAARVFVLIFSAHANRSPQVNREVERAVSKGLPIIPFRIEDVAPSDSLEYFISNQHWLDALTPPRDRHLARLADVVGRLLGEGIAVGPAALPEPKRNNSVRWLAGGLVAVLGAATLIALVVVILLLSRKDNERVAVATGADAAAVAPTRPAARPRTAPVPRPESPSRPPPAVTSSPGQILQCNTRNGRDPSTGEADRWWFRIDEQNRRWETWRQSDPRWVSAPCHIPESGGFANICFFRPAEFRYQNAATSLSPDGSVVIRTDYIINRVTGGFTIMLNNRGASGTCERSESPTPPPTRI